MPRSSCLRAPVGRAEPIGEQRGRALPALGAGACRGEPRHPPLVEWQSAT
ncbi:hypothetical protein STIAU_0175, partial [Stigmatella aurantiaca DW4/3-1]